ncbi:thiolase family protein [Parasphingopyxis marina]|uniref:Thiolase family protein n=1 Tax=Parasphingopyxis marina TaxID=2761622 RepID=A0A842HT38_9SPHN|nr:thiolase family protein [Parasphingopyxis marina]MBC2777038.1 thiolase family protein [Parasphingopyxis marina]
MTDTVIIGAGIHPFGRFDKSAEDIGSYAAAMALKDAGVAWSDIDASYLSRMYLPATSGARILRKLGATDMSIVDVEAACASGGVALRQAVLAIKSGECDVVMVLGAEKMPRGFMDPRMIYADWQIEMGMSMNPSYWSMRAMRHMHEFGTTEEQIAKIAYKNHLNSVHNPNAMYQKEFSMEEILGSTMVCDPIRKLEICAPDDGAAAVIVASEDYARKIGARAPIRIASCEHTVARYSADFRCPADSMSATAHNEGPTEVTAQKAYDKAGLGAEDIDCFEVQDTDAFCELEIYEELKLCPLGEGGRLIDEGVTTMTGAHPVNMSGGLISKGEPVGASHLGQVHELVQQLRGEAGPRQVENAKVGLGHVLGAGGNCAVTILQK